MITNFLVSTVECFQCERAAGEGGAGTFADGLIKSRMALKGHDVQRRTNLSWEAGSDIELPLKSTGKLPAKSAPLSEDRRGTAFIYIKD